MARGLRHVFLSLTVLAASLSAPFAGAATSAVSVGGIADIWLAGQPSGTVLNGGFPGSDVAPLNSPVLASSGLNLAAGTSITFAATGATDYNGCASANPEGGGACGGGSFPATLGISGYNGPINALVGVFLDAAVPAGPAPPTLDFSTPASLTQATLTPQLRQVFFIGDGLTGTGSGARQQFVIPAGATRLFLASSDGIGANYNNFGSFSVLASDAFAAQSLAAVPANDPLMLLLTAILLGLAGGHWIKSRSNARQR